MIYNALKAFIVCVLLIATSNIGLSQSLTPEIPNKPAQLIKEISGIIKKHSLYADSLNWKVIAKESAMLPLGENDSINHRIIFQFFTKNLRAVGDIHSFFMSSHAMSRYETDNHADQPKSTYLANGIGMITIPGFLVVEKSNVKEYKYFADNIRSQIREVDTHHTINGWIVDLRGNHGGNMWPMLAGLNALTKDGIVGYFISNKGEIPWYVRNGRMTYPKYKVSKYKIKNLHTKIAVLIDSTTASSGEATAISMIGLSNVRVFGEPSAGFTTANYTFNLSDGSMFNLATLYDADRNHRPYLGKIIPDVLVESKHDTSDVVLKTAEKWLRQTDRSN